MRLYSQLNDFYRDTPFRQLRARLMLERVSEDGLLRCEHCHEPIVKKYDCIAHHIIPLTMDNIYDLSISLNPENIQLVHHTCHNAIHERWGYGKPQRVYVVYGPPCSGKSSYVDSCREVGDLLVDMDRIWQAISGDRLYHKDKRLQPVVFAMHRELLDQVQMRVGKWRTAWIVGGYPFTRQREELCRKLSAEPIYIEASQEECIQHLREDRSRDGYQTEWLDYISEWFRRSDTPPT